MDNKEILKSLADIHNILMQVTVRGEDTLRMARVLTDLRGLTQVLSPKADSNV